MDYLKRRIQHEDDECADQNLAAAQHSKRRREDNSQRPRTCIIGKHFWPLVGGIEIDRIVREVTNLTRRIVNEELDRRIVLRSTINETGLSDEATKFYKLVFENELPATVYTFSNIKAKADNNEEDRLVKIALYDIRSQSIVTSGSLSSLTVEICVINDEIFGSCGSSNSDGEDYWIVQFKANIIRKMDNNKGKLLKGDVVIQLINGVGYINKMMFTDNSSRTRTRHLRLGAIVNSTSREADVKEAISNRFMVKDTRGEVNQKRYPPFENDPIWRLKSISKVGKIYHWLSNELKVNTVKDLLHVYESNPSSLQKNKYGTKLREAIKHAKTCIPEVTSSINHRQNCNPSQRITHNNLDDKTSTYQTLEVGQCSAPHLDSPTAAQQGLSFDGMVNISSLNEPQYVPTENNDFADDIRFPINDIYYYSNMMGMGMGPNM